MRKQINIGKLVGRTGDEFVVLEYVFKDKDFQGAVGCSMRPVSRREHTERMENAEEYLEDAWKCTVADGRTTLGLSEWVKDVLAADGDSALWDLSWDQFHDEICEFFNSELPPDHDPEDEAEFCEACGGGRMFTAAGITDKKWPEFDKIYCDQATLDLIKKYETQVKRRK